MRVEGTAYPRRREVEPGRFLLEYESVPSTQDIAREAVRERDDSVIDAIGVRTGCQSEGRGRRGARWVAPPHACLLITYIVRRERLESPGRLAFAAGVAVAESIQAVCGVIPSLKWPNDVYLAGKKVAGILIETESNAALIGIGLNVNVAAFPPELEDTATSLLRETGSEWPIDEMEAEVRRQLFASIELEWSEVLRRWRSRDCTKGRHYTAVAEGIETTGAAVAVDDTGALELRLDDGRTVAVMSATSVDK